MSWTLLAFIFGINVLYLTINTLRLLLQARGLIFLAPVFGFFEILCYTIGLNYVLKNLTNPIYLIAYAVGFAIGIGLGMLIERLLAIGYLMTEIIVPAGNQLDGTGEVLAEVLRSHGYGVTEFIGHGKNGERLLLKVLTPRKKAKQIYSLVNEIMPRAFITSFNPSRIQGGFWSRGIEK